MRAADRDALRRRFQFRCGYCGVSEQDVGAELTVDHFHPRSQGGANDPENWVYCCHACNEFKGDYWQPAIAERILHPLHDDLAAHLLEEANGVLSATSPTGAFHLERLRLNRPQLIAYRRERRVLDTARSEQTRILERLRQFERQLQALTDEIVRLERDETSA